MIIGKGNKQCLAKLILDQNAGIYLREWLELRGSASGALFCYITRETTCAAWSVIYRPERCI